MRGRQRILRLIVGVAFLLGSLAVYGDMPNPGESTDASTVWEAHRRATVVFFRAQMRWVFSGQYPSSLLELCNADEDHPVCVATKSELIDPCSSQGLLLRYRLSGTAPEVASIGLDHRWGGWEGRLFFGEDDICVSTQTAPSHLRQFLHTTYCQAVASGLLQYPSVILEGEDVDTATYSAICARIAGDPVDTNRIEPVVEALCNQLGLTVVDGAKSFEEATTGLRDCFAERRPPQRLSFTEALLILAESCPAWLRLEVWSSKGIALEIRHLPPVSDDQQAFWEMLSAQTDAEVMRLRGMMTDFGPSAVMVILPAPWFDDESYRRFVIVCHRLLGTHEQVVHRIPAGICVTGFESWSHAYFFVEMFGEFLPSAHDWLEARNQLHAGPK